MSIPVYIGYDTRERVAWHVTAHSIIERTRATCSFTPVGNTTLEDKDWWRVKGPLDATEFSTARFMVPYLNGFQGWAIFMDCDVICLEDILELWGQRDPRYAVQVVKHVHNPPEEHKFLGAEQTRYKYKNWTSLMLFNCGHGACKNLTPEYVNRVPGLDLHQFAWTDESLIGDIRGSWNVLSKPQGLEHPQSTSLPQLLHLTHGGPWHGVFTSGAGLWMHELRQMLAADNPRAAAAVDVVAPEVDGVQTAGLHITYGVTSS